MRTRVRISVVIGILTTIASLCALFRVGLHGAIGLAVFASLWLLFFSYVLPVRAVMLRVGRYRSFLRTKKSQ